MDNKALLQLVVDNSSRTGRECVLQPADLEYFDAAIERARGQLLEDLAYYQGRISDLQQMDPHNRTGLMTLYRAHEFHLHRLLGMLCEPPRAVRQETK